MSIRDETEVKDVLGRVSAALTGVNIQIYNQLYTTKSCGKCSCM